MDPTENLNKQLALARYGIGRDDLNEEWITQLAELVLELNEWIRRGGFLPDPWDKERLLTNHKKSERFDKY